MLEMPLTTTVLAEEGMQWFPAIPLYMLGLFVSWYIYLSSAVSCQKKVLISLKYWKSRLNKLFLQWVFCAVCHHIGNRMFAFKSIGLLWDRHGTSCFESPFIISLCHPFGLSNAGCFVNYSPYLITAPFYFCALDYELHTVERTNQIHCNKILQVKD